MVKLNNLKSFEKFVHKLEMSKIFILIPLIVKCVCTLWSVSCFKGDDDIVSMTEMNCCDKSPKM